MRQVDPIDRWLDLENGGTKNGEARKVRMACEVFELLSACVRGKSPDNFVFTRSSLPEARCQVVDPRDEWYTLCVRSGLGKYVAAKRKNGEEYNRYVGLNLQPPDFCRATK